MTKYSRNFVVMQNNRAGGGSGGSYIANNVNPKFVSDFKNGVYRTDGRTAVTASEATEFSTTGLATMTDSDGLMKWRPHNLVTYSEFDQVPAASGTDWLIGFNTGTFSHTIETVLGEQGVTHVCTSGRNYLYQDVSVVIGAQYTMKVKVDVANSSAGATDDILGIAGAGMTAFAEFQEIDEDGWVTVTATATATSTATFRVGIGVSGTETGTLKFALPHVYRSDLGGMVNNPETGDSYVRTAGREISAELVTNGTFDENVDGWTAASATLSHNNGVLDLVDDGAFSSAYQAITTEVGKIYRVTGDFVTVGSGTSRIHYGVTAPNPGVSYGDTEGASSSSPGSFSFTFTATGTTTYINLGAEGTATSSFDNISVKQIDVDPSAARYLPRDGHHKKTGANKYNAHNLLTYSEDFSSLGTNAAGTGSAPVVTANAALAPDGSMTADRVQFDLNGGTTVSDISAFQEVAGVDGVNRTLRLWIKTVDGSAGQIHFRNGTNSPQLFAVTGEWTQITTDFDGSDTTILIGLRGGIGGTSDALDVYLWGLHLYRSDLEVSANSGNSVSGLYVPTDGTAVPATFVPATFVNKGRRLESEARTNLVLTRDITDSAWTKQLTASTPPAETTGYSGDTAYVITANAGGPNGKIVYNTAGYSGLVADGTYTISVVVKAGTHPYVFLNSQGTTNVFFAAVFDLSAENTEATQTGVGSTSGTVLQTHQESLGDGYYRISLTGSHSNTTAFAMVGFTDAATGNTFGSVGQIPSTTTGTETFIMQYPQFEAGATPSSYIPTNGSTVTRPAETLVGESGVIPWAVQNFATGTELVTNGTFDDNVDGWTAGAGSTATYVSGTLEVVRTSLSSVSGPSIPTTVGAVYQISADITGDPGRITVTGATDVLSASGSAFFVATSTTTNIAVRSSANGQTTYFDNISVKELSSNYGVSIAVKGEMDYADIAAFGDATFIRWHIDNNNRILWQAANTDVVFYQFEGGTGDTVTVSSVLSPGLNVPFNIASYHQPNGINGAVGGTVGTENTTPTAFADLSSTDIDIGYEFMGTIEHVLIYDVAIGDAGIEAITS